MRSGGPNANLAGVFQLNSVTRHHGLTRVITDWEVGVPGFFATFAEAMLDRARLAPGDRILDVATGTGTLLRR